MNYKYRPNTTPFSFPLWRRRKTTQPEETKEQHVVVGDVLARETSFRVFSTPHNNTQRKIATCSAASMNAHQKHPREIKTSWQTTGDTWPKISHESVCCAVFKTINEGKGTKQNTQGNIVCVSYYKIIHSFLACRVAFDDWQCISFLYFFSSVCRSWHSTNNKGTMVFFKLCIYV